jgi:hypothetical protein
MKRYLFSTSMAVVSGVGILCVIAAFVRSNQVVPIDLNQGTPWARPIEPRQKTGLSAEEAIRRGAAKLGVRFEDQVEPDSDP